ncbi:hypothetical protein [Pedobacter aquatilis]|uniref:hypothetical protein n=1 Tax=Pedobacter aquatilis TaxID=351343 RepID=UPI00292DD77D|nr:hypothetical protein [Pedobacter aquatilis]
MKRFIFRLLIIIGITLIFDRTLAFVVNYFYKTATTTDEYKINYVTYKMDDPIVFMGSSRCHHHYIPSILEDSLKRKVYNAGLWGMRNVYFQYAFLSNILQNNTPKTIFLEIHPTDYLKTPFSGLDVVGNLSPFINYSEGCDDVLKKAKFFYKGEVSHLYRYNSLFANLALGNMFQRINPENKGYKPLYGELDLSHGPIKPEKFDFDVDNEKVKYLKSFIDKCKEKRINLILLFSPMYAVEKNNMFDIPYRLAKENNLVFINNYNMAGITGHQEYFHDFGHLNDTGAKKYSIMIASQLKKYLK